MQAFEWHVPDDQAHWNRLHKALPSLKDIGVDNIWIPPGCKGMSPSANGYDIYDLYDLGEFEQKGSRGTKWGTKAELQELIWLAQDLGIGVYWDAVLNHKAAADYTERFSAVKVDPRRELVGNRMERKFRWLMLSQNEIMISRNQRKLKAGWATTSPAAATSTAR